MNKLIFKFLNKETTSEETKQVIEWVKASPENAREFARTSSLHGQLRMHLSSSKENRAALDLEPALTETRAETVAQSSKVIRMPKITFGMAAGIAACLALLLTLLLVDREKPVALLVQNVDAEWIGESVSVASHLKPQTLKLKSGIVSLLFSSGVEVTLEGPAEYEIFSVDKTKLHSGILAAYVPPGAEGFVVDTQALEVTDLGTSFGVTADEEGVDVAVFDGEVEVLPANSSVKQSLTEGQSARLQHGGELERVEIDVEPFMRLWPVATGISSASESFQFARPWPPLMRMTKDDSKIMVYMEKRPAPLEEDLVVNAVDPGRHPSISSDEAIVLKKGTVVRSHMLQFNPGTNGPEGQRMRHASGEIRFANPIIALIYDTEKLTASDFLSRMKTPIKPFARGLETSPERLHDYVTMSSDRHSLTVDLQSVAKGWDQVRVILAPDAAQRVVKGE